MTRWDIDARGGGEHNAARGNLEVRALCLPLAMEDVERVFRIHLQAADALGAEGSEVEAERLQVVHTAEVDLVLGLGSGLGMRSGLRIGVGGGFKAWARG